jgi:asparaginyl-tRNA synthetase
MDAVRIADLADHVGAEVALRGWLTGSRSSGKIAFLQLRDGSGFVQAVVSRADVGEDAFALRAALTQESAVRVRGEVRADPRSPSGSSSACATSNASAARRSTRSRPRSTASTS